MARGRGRWPADAHLVDLSLSGAKVAVADAEPLHLGGRVEIGLGDARGTAVVRRAQRKAAHGTVYGIQFVDLDPAMRAAISEVLAADKARAAT